MRLFTFICLCLSVKSFSQTDTVYKYFDKDWKPVSKEQAFFIGKAIYEHNSWHQLDYWASTNIMQMDGWFEDADAKTENGSVVFYSERGIIRDSNNYVHGALMSKYVFYENHHLKGFAMFNQTGQVVSQAGYDENDNVIPGYIFQQEATFPGGVDAWTKYLIKGLTTKQPRAYQDGKMSGTVVVTFLVDREGLVQEVQVGTSSGYTELDEHAVNVIKHSPKWNPAIQYNQKVIYRQKQSLTYAPQN